MVESQRREARILLVDDDRTMLAALCKMVEEAGFTALSATNWSEALARYREEKPDLILLDVMMPTIDGFKLARIIKGDGGSFVPIILLTALDDMESKRRAMAAGADDFLSKPVTPLELSIRVSSMLRIKDLTDQLEDANVKLMQLAVTDPLTGLHNRRSLYGHLEREFARAMRYEHPLSLAMIDIDFFKKVNDTYGHQVGDDVLRLVGHVLMESVRNTDVPGRFGGEEFMVLAPDTGLETVNILGERIRSSVQAASGAAPDPVPEVTVSIGIATTDAPMPQNFDELVHAADGALYKAKRSGRNRIVMAKELLKR